MEPCGLCDRAIEQATSLKGIRADLTKFMFVLHKPDSRIYGNLFDEKTNYDVALGGSKTGQELKLLLSHCKLDIEDILLTNFFKCTLPEDKNPRVKEYRNCAKVFEEQILEFDPKKIIIFSGFVQKYLPQIERPHLIMPHPSRIWAWRNKDKRKAKYEEVRSFLYS